MKTNKKILALFFLVCISALSSFAQTTIEIPISRNALLKHNTNPAYAERDDQNYNNDPEMTAWAWTHGSSYPTTRRSILDFDFSALPEGAHITKAELKLVGNGHRTAGSGVNSSWLELISEAWDETQVTWNNQPATIETNRVPLEAATSANQEYTLDILPLVLKCFNSPSTSHGVMLKLQGENRYAEMSFGSPTHPDPNKRPVLTIEYLDYAAKNKNTGKKYSKIALALDEVQEDQTILIAPGIHYEHNLKAWTKNIRIEAESYKETIIDGENLHSIIHKMLDGYLVVEDITFQNGYSHLSVFSINDGASFIDCKFINNESVTSGVIDFSGGDNSVVRCEFSNNTGRVIKGHTTDYISVTNSTFDNNSGWVNVMIESNTCSNIRIEKSTFTNNDYSILFKTIEGRLDLSKCTISSNDVTNIVEASENSLVWMSSSKVLNNTCRRVIYSTSTQPVLFTTSVIKDNNALGHIAFNTNSYIHIQQSTIAQNNYARSMYSFYGDKVFVKNSIIWDEETTYGPRYPIKAINGVWLEYSCIRGGLSEIVGEVKKYEGNLEHEPSLTEEGRLIEGDPCIGAGYFNLNIPADIESVNFTDPMNMGAYAGPTLKSGSSASQAIAEETEISNNIISLYPNPTNGQVTVQGVSEGTSISVVNASGSVVLKTVAEPETTSIDLSNLPEGVYYVQVISGTNTVNKTVVLKK